MQLLTRYVVGQVCLVFAVTLTVITCLLLMVGIGREALAEGLSPVYMARLIPYVLPSALLFSVPVTLLFAVSVVYGRMSGSNELIALKASGINPLAMVWPTLVLAAMLSMVTVWLNDVSMSWGYRGVQQVILGAVEDIIYDMLRTNRSYSTRGFSIIVERVDGHVLVHPIFTFEPTNDSPPVTISAREAEFRALPSSGILVVRFRNGTIEVGGSTLTFPDVLEREIPLDLALRKGDASQAPAHLPLRAIPEQIERQKTSITEAEERLAAQAAFDMMSGNLVQLRSLEWSGRLNNLKEQRQNLYRLQTESPRRWANGFSCLGFVLVGVPVAIRLRNTGVMTIFFICFLPILIAYYPLLMFGAACRLRWAFCCRIY